MKKIAFLLMLLLGVVTSVSLVSCGDDDNETEATSSSILGTWRHDNSNSHGSEYVLIQFLSDGKFYNEWWVPTTSGETKLYEAYEGTWTLSGSTLTCKTTTGENKSFKVSMSGSNLIIDGDSYYKVN